MHEVLGVLMMRFWAVTGSSCLVISSGTTWSSKQPTKAVR